MPKSKSTRRIPRAALPPAERLAPYPDSEARRLWDRAYVAAGRVSGIMDGISWNTVGGERTRDELRAIAELLEQAATTLKGTYAREARRFRVLERQFPGGLPLPQPADGFRAKVQR